MNKNQETPEARRERLRQQELKRNPAAMQGGGIQDLIGDLGWKGTGILFLLIVIAIVIYLAFFN